MTRYRHDLDAARRRLAARERHSIQTPMDRSSTSSTARALRCCSATPLVGGFDTGLGCAEAWIGDGFRVIAPSRFGYLGSSLPPGGMPADQADAYALLLDALEVERAAVVGFSAGGPSVVQFALRHPDRTAGLVLFGSALPGKAGAPPKPVAQLLFTDLVFWTLKPTCRGCFCGAWGCPRAFSRPRPVDDDLGERGEPVPIRPRKHGLKFGLLGFQPRRAGTTRWRRSACPRCSSTPPTIACRPSRTPPVPPNASLGRSC